MTTFKEVLSTSWLTIGLVADDWIGGWRVYHIDYKQDRVIRAIETRKKVGFFDWIGLKKVESQQKRRLLLTILGISLLFLLFSIVVFAWFDSSQTATAAFSGKGSLSCYLGLCYLRDCLARRNLL